MPNGRTATKPPAHAAPDAQPSDEFLANEAQNKSIAAVSGASKASGDVRKVPTGPAKHTVLQSQLLNPRRRGRQSSDPDLAQLKRPGSDANLKRWETETEAGRKLAREGRGDEEVSDEFEANEEARQEG
jgi:hypothetical protein